MQDLQNLTRGHGKSDTCLFFFFSSLTLQYTSQTISYLSNRTSCFAQDSPVSTNQMLSGCRHVRFSIYTKFWIKKHLNLVERFNSCTLLQV
jgi:hypothetical protein